MKLTYIPELTILNIFVIINVMNQKGFAPLFILLVVVLMAGLAYGSYYLSTQKAEQPQPATIQTNNPTDIQAIPTLPSELTTVRPTSISTATSTTTVDETADWKTYTNFVHGFLIKYPANWFSSNCNNESLLLLHAKGTPSCIDISGGQIVLEIYLQGKLNLISDSFGNYAKNLQSSNLKGDIKKYYLTTKDQNIKADKQVLYEVALKNNYELRVLVFDKLNEGISDLILSTFKFTD